MKLGPGRPNHASPGRDFNSTGTTLAAASPFPIQPGMACDCVGWGGGRHDDGLTISRFYRVLVLRQRLLRTADTVCGRRSFRPRRYPILCDRRSRPLADPAPMDVLHGHLAVGPADYLRHFGGSHTPMASTIWRSIEPD